MPRQFLDKNQIRELARMVCEVFSFLSDCKEQNSLAEHIQFPKTPTILTESLVRHLINDGRILAQENVRGTDFGGRKADVLVEKRDGTILKVEVKGTAMNAFQEFTTKDIAGDYLVWVHRGTYSKRDLPPNKSVRRQEPIQIFRKQKAENMAQKIHCQSGR